MREDHDKLNESVHGVFMEIFVPTHKIKAIQETAISLKTVDHMSRSQVTGFSATKLINM